MPYRANGRKQRYHPSDAKRRGRTPQTRGQLARWRHAQSSLEQWDIARRGAHHQGEGSSTKGASTFNKELWGYGPARGRTHRSTPLHKLQLHSSGWLRVQMKPGGRNPSLSRPVGVIQTPPVTQQRGSIQSCIAVSKAIPCRQRYRHRNKDIRSRLRNLRGARHPERVVTGSIPTGRDWRCSFPYLPRPPSPSPFGVDWSLGYINRPWRNKTTTDSASFFFRKSPLRDWDGTLT